MKIVIIGGHLSPSLAVIDKLPKDTQILFIGRKFALEGDKSLSAEYKIVTERKIPFIGITTGRLQRKFTRYTIPSLFKIPYGFFQALSILRKFKPDVVLGFGGYVSLPVILAAFFLKIPSVIHEQTLEAGSANKFLSRFVSKICISWESSFAFFPIDKTILTGNPLRKEILESLRFNRSKSTLPTIYVTGGSTGSHSINSLVEGVLRQLLEKFNIIHQVGDAKEYGDFESLLSLRDTFPENLQKRYAIKKFIDIDKIGPVFQNSDLIIGRSGINTITELMFFQKPALLIPLPFSQSNEQMKNAIFLKSKGLAEVYSQNELNSLRFLQVVTKMFNNINTYRLRFNSNNLLVQDASQKIIEVVTNAAKKKK